MENYKSFIQIHQFLKIATFSLSFFLSIYIYMYMCTHMCIYEYIFFILSHLWIGYIYHFPLLWVLKYVFPKNEDIQEHSFNSVISESMFLIIPFGENMKHTQLP